MAGAKTELKKSEDKTQLPAGLTLEDLQADAQDNEVMSTADVALPYLTILQTSSPEVNPGLPDFIPEATASMIMNTVSGDVFDGRGQGIMVIPCAYERKLVEWTARESGGGWIKDYDANDPIASTTKPNDKGKPVLPNGHLLVETAYQYMLWMNPDTGSWSQGVIALASTALKVNRKWNNDITTSKIPNSEHQAPRYLYPYQLTTWLESKAGNSWWSYKVQKHEEPISADLYKQAKEFATLVRDGVLKRSQERPDAAKDPDIPF